MIKMCSDSYSDSSVHFGFLLFSCGSKLYCIISIFKWMVWDHLFNYLKFCVATIHRHVLQPLPPKIVCAPT
jgi:cellulose synthase/poly-beta-1,6-N-acetylglucosamine synthase-like glycosyltransferase